MDEYKKLDMMVRTVEYIGGSAINYCLGMVDFFMFIITSLVYILNPLSYTKINFNNLLSYIYFSSVRTLPLFFILALFLGSVIIGVAIMFAINYNLQNQVGKILVSFVVNEFAPLFTTFFIFYQYGFKIYDDIKVSESDKNNFYENFYIPSLLNGLISVPSLSLFFAIVMLVSGYVVSSLYLYIDLKTYINLITNGIELENIIILLVKGMVFGFIATILPIYHAKKHKNNISKIDTAQYTIKILVTLFSFILFIDILLLFVIY